MNDTQMFLYLCNETVTKVYTDWSSNVFVIPVVYKYYTALKKNRTIFLKFSWTTYYITSCLHNSVASDYIN